MEEYFSYREGIIRPPSSDAISYGFLKGIIDFINAKIDTGAFGLYFPDTCPDNSALIIGTDRNRFLSAIKLEIPHCHVLFNLREHFGYDEPDDDTHIDAFLALDLIEFVYRYISHPIEGGWHSFFNHSHLDFDQEKGRNDLLLYINRVFRMNSLRYEMNAVGAIVRKAPVEIQNIISHSMYRSPDENLNSLVESACRKFTSPDINERKIALKEVWDALEAIEGRSGGRKSIINSISTGQQPHFDRNLDNEIGSLFDLGNNLRIRHHKERNEVVPDDIVDYLFSRAIRFIHLYFIRSGWI